MSTQIYEAKPYTNIRQASEEAIRIAQGINSDVIVVFNDTRFTIKPDTKTQDAIDTYLAIRDKMTKAQQQLKQHTM